MCFNQFIKISNRFLLNSINYNKKKIFNDPLHGFISLPYDILFDLIEHPYFQRLRRIKQLGLTHLVYPGALHTRFHHALGAMYLTNKALDTIQSKGIKISVKEKKACCIAILLHDIGHGPFSHALEYSLVKDVTHEDISVYFMEKLNLEFEGKLDLAIKIFKNQYERKFLHQLISSQLDMDRLDYLKRDSYFTGVSEGVVGVDRIIAMLTVSNDELCIESKGIYSVEKFLIARRLMYWQVYLHKTVLSAENLIVKILQRAKVLANEGKALFATDALKFFLYHTYDQNDFQYNPEVLEKFAQLDDFDITASIKMWQFHEDKILSWLCKAQMNRRLYKVEIFEKAIDKAYIQQKREEVKSLTSFSEEQLAYFVFQGKVENKAYNKEMDKIRLIDKHGEQSDIIDASDHLNINTLSTSVQKYFLCYPKQNSVDNFDV